MNQYIKYLKLNQIGVLPHDTIPGIVARMTEANAARILDIKKRSEKKGFIILIPNIDHLENLAIDINSQTQKLIKTYWPGALTVIFKKSNSIPTLISGSEKTIAIRYPNHKLLNTILDSINEPLITTSANISNEQHLSKELLEQVDFIHPDINPSIPNGLSSTIIDSTSEDLQILRQGSVLISS